MPCPIAGYRIDENAARVVAVAVLSLVSLAVWSGGPLAAGLFAFLVLDFATRALSRPRWSPLGRAAGALLKAVGRKPRLVDAGPKRFAARIGLASSLALLVLSLAGAVPPLRAVAAVLAVCAALEGFAGLCLGCQAWTLWWALRDRLSARV